MAKVQTTVHIKRLEKRLNDVFGGKIDLSDWNDKPEPERRKNFLTRALAAYSLIALTGTDPAAAANAVTDGYADNGIDAVLVDPPLKTVYFVQSKWREDGARGVEQADVLKFMRGIGKILQLQWADFNDKILRRKEALSEAVYDSDTKFIAVVVAPVNDLISSEAQKVIDEELGNINGKIDPIISIERFDLQRLYESLFETAGSSSIDLEVTLAEWGCMSAPYLAYYGQIEVGDIMAWRAYGQTLFERNLRPFQGQKTDVFLSIAGTLSREPEHLWYFNNGATMLCKSLKKKPIYGEKRDKGIFDCAGVSIVNGAQTIGSIWNSGKDGTLLDPRSKIPIRIISLEKCPVGFTSQITRAANTQNRIGSRDFAALDPNQQRLAGEMALEGRRYVFRSGDPFPPGAEGCEIAEAAACLASKISLELAVKAKREVGLLWENIEREPYTLIFNADLASDFMWRVVRIGRAVERELSTIANDEEIFRGKLIATHGNRLILHRVLKDPQLRLLDRGDIDQLCSVAAVVALRELRSVASYIKANDPTGYPQMFFKSYERCRDMSAKLDGPYIETPVGEQTYLRESPSQ